MSAYGVDASPDEVDVAWFAEDMRRAAAGDGIIIDGSRLGGGGGAAKFAPHFDAVGKGWLTHHDEVIGGVRQVPFFRITDAGRAWIATVPR